MRSGSISGRGFLFRGPRTRRWEAVLTVADRENMVNETGKIEG